MKYRLLVLDIDGTVANSHKKISPRTREAVIGLQEQGVCVVLASGRPPAGVYPVAKELKIDRFGNYILAYNGASLIECSTHQHVNKKLLPSYLPSRLLKDALDYGFGLIAYGDHSLMTGTETDEYMELESRITGLPIDYREDFSTYTRVHSVNQCLITGNPDDLENLEPVFSRKYCHEAQVFHSEPFYLEVTPKGIDKAYGIKQLLTILGIGYKETVCCGDSFNDVKMLQYAGVGVAMANAPNRVKWIADYVTVNDNDHDGIVEVIERFF